MKKANSGKIYNRSSGRSRQTSAYAYLFKQRIAFAALFLAFIMLLSMVLEQRRITESFASGSTMTIAGETEVDVNIASLNFDRATNRLYNAFNNDITAVLSNNNILDYGRDNSYGLYMRRTGGRSGHMALKQNGADGVLNGLTELSVELSFWPSDANGPYYLFFAAPSDTGTQNSPHLGIYVQGNKLTAEMVKDGNTKTTCTYTIRTSTSSFNAAGEHKAKVVFAGTDISIYIDDRENVDSSQSHTQPISVADCVGSTTNGIAWFGETNWNDNRFYGSMDNIIVTGKRLVASTAPNPNIPPSGDDHKNENWAAAMHFIIRHWHAVKDPNTDFQDGTGYDATAGRYFVVGEGYIVPNGNSYRFYMIDQSKTGDERYTRITDTGNKYIDKIDETNGIIELVEAPVYGKDGTTDVPLEEFTGFAVSAGHSAVASVRNENNELLKGKITITYDANIHLVKTHFFYNDISTDEYNQELFGGTSATEQDTKYVYVYIKDYTSADGVLHEVGDLVEDSTGKFVTDKKNLPAGLVENVDVAKLKVYNTSEGLHTDKTASVSRDYDDGRTFDLDLEAWYSGSSPVDIGLVLDSSGSMGFASEDLRPIQLSDADISALGGTVTRSGYNNPWNSVFLTAAQVAKILDSNYTDNSRLGETAYNYYVYDGRSSVKEYVPLAYWDGTVTVDPDSKTKLEEALAKLNAVNTSLDQVFNFNNTSDRLASNTNARAWYYSKNSNNTPLWTNGSNAAITGAGSTNNISIVNDAYQIAGGSASNSAMMLGKQYGFTLTVSFTLNAQGGGEFGNNNGQIDLLYIGEMSSGGGFLTDKGYVRLYLGSDGNLYVDKLNVGGGSTNYKINVGSLGDPRKSYKITVTLSNPSGETAVSVYVDDTKTGAYTMERLKNTNNPNYIVFNGFSGGGYSGPNLAIDDIEIYTRTLSDEQVRIINGTYDPFASVTNGDNIAKAGAHVIGTVGAAHLNIDANLNITGDAGWYYVNHTSRWDDMYYKDGIETAKVLCGPQKNVSTGRGYFVDQIMVPKSDTTNAGSRDAKQARNGGGYNYLPYYPESSATKFYIDSAGYLRCFFYTNSNDDEWRSSYVYMSYDSDYVKSEALQRALGFFTTKLHEASPESKLSATRFSTSEAKNDLDKLVMLDWTKDTGEVQGIMSLERGTGTSSKEGGTRDSDTSSYGVEQYNYGLTGQTSTWTGLKSFYDNLATNNKAIAGDTCEKYLIVFTDGRDTDIDTSGSLADIRNRLKQMENQTGTAPYYAKQLRDMGYTIFCVMLTGGTITPKESAAAADGEYEIAKAFLETIASSPSYVFTTEDTGLDGGAPTQSKVDQLTSIFTERILTIILDKLDEYDVKDYLDPRFDLVDADGNTWHLNAGGSVTVVDSDGQKVDQFTLDNNGKEVILATNVEEKAQTARLYYDSSAKMYYLHWVDQTIPNGKVGITEVNPWHGRITVRAKDDFLGGNDVLTNGNAEFENYVYNPNSTDTGANANSSGINDTVKGTNNNDVSKGFPRTTVNVMPPIGDAEDGQTIYEGEGLTAKEIANRIRALFEDENNIITDEEGELLKEENPTQYRWEYLRSRYYWEYLCRYAKANPDGLLPKYEELAEEQAYAKRLEDLIERILAAGEDGYEINYYYLDDDYPDNVKTTQTGEKHTSDCLGTLKYTWTENIGHKASDADYDVYKYPNGPTKDTNTRQSRLSVSYDPKTADERSNDGDNADLVAEGAYKWNRDYKPEVGDPADWERFDSDNKPVESPFTSTGTYTTKIVSGEIILQMVVSKQVKKALGDGTIIYTANLVREYDGDSSVVGTYEVTYTGDSSSEESIVTAKITLSDDYKAYVAEYGLPIGTYTLSDVTKKSGSPLIRFKTLYNVDITLAENRNLWTLFTEQLLPGESDAMDQIQTDKAKEAAAGQYASPTNRTNTAYHGTNPDNPSDKDDYLDDLYSLFRIELETVGAIKVVKYAQPAADDVQFGFTVTLKPPAGAVTDPNTFTVIDQNGEADLEWSWDAQKQIWTAEFSLKDSGWIEIIDLPADWVYTVYETNQRTDKFYNLETVETTDQGADLDLSNGGGSGKTVLGEELEWIFTNVVRLYDMPSVGAALPMLWIFRFLGTALLIVAACMILYKKRRSRAV